ncbi:MAG: hypothetical protein CFE24_01350 [Flavobacterium sp. BFFFF2]|nr:MAG: hypothetical protein CFE24_01350 [Flavobacterium sp. BFFFF2]
MRLVRQSVNSWLWIGLFMCGLLHAQNRQLQGTVQDTLGKPLEYANIIAQPKQTKADIRFAIANEKGHYVLQLDSEVAYDIKVSYLGFSDAVYRLEAQSDAMTHNFIMKSTGQQLKEIVIQYEYKPIEVKKDTLIFDAKAFANGHERKLKELLEKLPGVAVDKKGIITVQGKKVTKMLVEGKSFFGGGSKLAVENIPADAINKVQVLDHFNEVGFMKQVSDSDELAMNVTLKDDKKKFVFGDVEAGAGNNPYYLAHAGLFYYSPKGDVSYIGDLNNMGKSTFTIDDLIRFDGGFSQYLSGQKSFGNLLAFANNDTDVVVNQSKFSALNGSAKLGSLCDFSAFALLSDVLTQNQTTNWNQYLQNNTYSVENKTQNLTNSNTLGMLNMRLSYSPNKNEKWQYNTQLQAANNKMNSYMQSVTLATNNKFETLTQADNLTWKQFLEWHKNYNLRHTSTVVVQHVFEQHSPNSSWLNNQPFNTNILPIQNDAFYRIEQTKKTVNQQLDVMVKHYWLINRLHHLYTAIGNNYQHANYITSEQQRLSNGNIVNWADLGFGNQVFYDLNDAYFGVEYKFKIGKWTSKPGIYLHAYRLQTQQNDGFNALNKVLWQPQWNCEYAISKSETFELNYRLVNAFAEAYQMASRLTLSQYNAVFKGNALLQNEQYHSSMLRYFKNSSLKGFNAHASISFSKKDKSIRNQVEIDGINQYSRPVLQNNPETSWRMQGSVSQRVSKLSVEWNSSLSWFSYVQSMNNMTSSNQRNNQDIGVTLKTASKKWPLVSVTYERGWSQFVGLSTARSMRESWLSEVEISFLKHWTYKADYVLSHNWNVNGQVNSFDVLNTSLMYQRKNSPFLFQVVVQNAGNIQSKNDNSFSDFVISQNQTYILPRVYMLTVSYKL